MDLKKKLKEFFSLSRKRNGGFTLVELIVVIAVLAILGGVAVPAYSGYVTKANRAADEQLLGTINKAYAAACLRNGVDMAQLPGAYMPPLNSDKTINASGVNPFGDAFAEYYAGNEAAAFKVYQNIVFDDSVHRFVDSADAESISVMIGGVVYKADAESVEAYLNSTLGQSLTTPEVLDMVNIVSGALGEDFAVDDFEAAILTSSYKSAAEVALGLPEGTSYDEYIAAKKNELKQQYIKEHYPNYESLNRSQKSDADDAAEAAAEFQIKEIEKNLIPVVSASKAEEAGRDILTILQSNTAKDTLVGNVNSQSNSALGMSQSALAYALYSSYAVSEGEEPNTVGFIQALQGTDGGKFKTYLGKEQAETDLAGILGVMNVIANQNSETLESTVTNGLNNDDLENALIQILGK